MSKKEENNPPTSEIKRPPVVVILGHIDHGKTTLLDYIRKTNVAEKESGSITQHIGAYEISYNGEKMTFIDTPGHEAFSKMRSRGAQVADVAVLIVAADEGLKPQTKEAIKHAKDANLTMMVAINKIDKPEASPEKVKQQLTEEGVMLEGWGGTVSNQEISAKSGKGVNELLDLILLTAELEEFKADPELQGQGIVIETETSPQTGNAATLLIMNGKVKKGDFITAGSAYGKIKSIADDLGKTTKEASFSAPIRITGFDSLPKVGEEFYIATDKKEAEKLAELSKETESLGVKLSSSEKSDKKLLNIILKADVSGTKEALEELIDDLVFEEVAANVAKSEVGELTESDIKFARSTGSTIVGFKIKISPIIKKLAEQHEVKIVSGSIIYEILEKIKKEMSNMLEPEITKNIIGKLQILAVFKMDKTKMIAGGKVIDGKILRGAKIDVKRDGEELISGKLSQLQHNKEDVKEVSLGKECGITFSPNKSTEEKIEVGDILDIYEEEVSQRAL